MYGTPQIKTDQKVIYVYINVITIKYAMKEKDKQQHGQQLFLVDKLTSSTRFFFVSLRLIYCTFLVS